MTRNRFSILFLFLLVGSTTAQESASSYFMNFVQPHLNAYAACAKQHVVGLAQRDPSNSFERIEITLRQACGAHTDYARDAMSKSGLDRSATNSVIRTAYNGLQPELRTLYDQAGAQERQRRNAAREEIARERLARQAEANRQQQAKETEQEREKLLKEAAGEHDKCLIDQMREIVPFSNESAETLGQVIVTKCSEAERKYLSLGIAFYGGSKAELQKIVKDAVEERKKHIVADIVTFRAAVTKEMLKDSKPSGQGSPQSPANKI